MCKYGQKEGVCEEAIIWITKKGVMDCFAFTKLEPITVEKEPR